MNDVFTDQILNEEHELPDFDDDSINDYEEEPHQYKDSTYEIVSSILSLPECVPQESIKQLNADGIIFYKNSNTQLYQHIIEINKIISDRINNCKTLFPLWLNWQYIKQLFIMPNGLTEAGTKVAANTFYTNLNLYPYKVYINWTPQEQGNILYNDKKFVTLLYDWNGSAFTEYSKVSDAGSYVKGTIYDYIEGSEKVVVVVDCENSDPYKLSATLRNLDYTYTQKISSIILFDDVHTASAWGKEATPKGKLRIVEYRKDYDKKETTRRIVPSYEFSVEDFDIWKQKLMDEALEQRRHDDRTTRNNVNIDNLLETDLVATESVADEMIREEDERQAYERQMKKLNEILSCLTEVQRRRYIQHIAYGKTTREIADEEGCSFQMVAKSIAQAEERIEKAKANRNNN